PIVAENSFVIACKKSSVYWGGRKFQWRSTRKIREAVIAIVCQRSSLIIETHPGASLRVLSIRHLHNLNVVDIESQCAPDCSGAHNVSVSQARPWHVVKRSEVI